MSTLARDVIGRAIVKSFKNTPATYPVNQTELVEQLWKVLVWVFDAIASANPAFLETTVAVSSNGSGWPRPTDAYSVVRLERTTGDEVVPLPYVQRTIEAGLRPAVYERGGVWYPAGNAGDPALSEQLIVTYSPAPARPLVDTDPIDPRLPDRYMAVLEFGIATHISRKDSRADDATTQEQEAQGWLTLILEHVKRVGANEVRLSGYPLTFPNKATAAVPQ